MQDKKKKIEKLKQALAEIIEEERLEQNKSVSCISAEILMSKSVWNNIEKGIRDPQYSTLWCIAEALGTTVDELNIKIRKRLGNGFSISDL